VVAARRGVRKEAVISSGLKLNEVEDFQNSLL